MKEPDEPTSENGVSEAVDLVAVLLIALDGVRLRAIGRVPWKGRVYP